MVKILAHRNWYGIGRNGFRCAVMAKVITATIPRAVAKRQPGMGAVWSRVCRVCKQHRSQARSAHGRVGGNEQVRLHAGIRTRESVVARALMNVIYLAVNAKRDGLTVQSVRPRMMQWGSPSACLKSRAEIRTAHGGAMQPKASVTIQTDRHAAVEYFKYRR